MTTPGLTDVLHKLLSKKLPSKGNKSIILRNEKIEVDESLENEEALRKQKVDSSDEGDDEPDQKVARSHIKSKVEKSRQKQDNRMRWIREAFKGDSESMRESAIREKYLRRQATRATVQLFNAVREHQSKVRASLEAEGTTEAKREKVEKQHSSSIEFLKRLERKKGEEKNNGQSSDKWKQYLKNDFAMGSKMKAWDLESEESDN